MTGNFINDDCLSWPQKRDPWIAYVQRSEVAVHQHHSGAVWGYLSGTSLSERQRRLFVYHQCFGWHSSERSLTPRYTSPRLIAAQSQEPLSRDRTKPVKLGLISCCCSLKRQRLCWLTEGSLFYEYSRLDLDQIQRSNWPQKRWRDSCSCTLRQGFSTLLMARHPKYDKYPYPKKQIYLYV